MSKTDVPMDSIRVQAPLLRVTGVSGALPSSQRQHKISADFCVGPGEVLRLEGSSGLGKTTLLRRLAHLPNAFHWQTGAIELFRGIPALLVRSPRFGLLPQDPVLFPGISLERQWAEATRVGRSQHLGWSDESLHKWKQSWGLHGLERKTSSELSGGQRQRAAILVLLCSCPDVLLLDEPFSASDPVRISSLWEAIADWAKMMQRPVIISSHVETPIKINSCTIKSLFPAIDESVEQTTVHWNDATSLSQ